MGKEYKFVPDMANSGYFEDENECRAWCTGKGCTYKRRGCGYGYINQFCNEGKMFRLSGEDWDCYMIVGDRLTIMRLWHEIVRLRKFSYPYLGTPKFSLNKDKYGIFINEDSIITVIDNDNIVGLFEQWEIKRIGSVCTGLDVAKKGGFIC